MTTRRELITSGLGLAAIIAAGKAPAAFIKSAIAARSGMGGKKQITAKDYVQSGLVLLFSAIENAGWGVHDDSATEWVNLASGISYPLIGSSYFSSNKLVCPNVSSGAKFQKIGNAKMIEIVFLRKNGNTGISVICPSGANNDATKVIYYKTSSGIYGYQLGANNKPLIHFDNISTIHSVSFDIQNSNGYGDSVITSYKSYDAWGLGTADYGFINISPGMSRGAIADYYCVRIYNRSLSDTERLNNYEVDKILFNVP